MKRNPFLRVKLKSLAAEAKIIRAEEERARKRGDFHLVNELHDHRVFVVRRQTRATLLAYQFLRGVPYAKVEPESLKSKARTDTYYAAIKMASKYGGLDYNEDTFQRWLAGEEVVSKAA